MSGDAAGAWIPSSIPRMTLAGVEVVVRVVADVGFLLIEPLRYPWADSIRQSLLPRTVS